MRIKSLLLIAIAAVLGPWLLYSGVKDQQNSQRLAAEGKTTTAQVLDRTIKSGSRGGDRYYLTVKFQTEAGQTVQQRVLVTKTEYLEDVAGSNVSLRYLASAPTVCAVGEPVATWRGKWTSGTIMLLSGGVLAVCARRRKSTREVAEKVAESVNALCESHYEYIPVNAKEFKHLDLEWYDASHRWLEESGFAFLGDEENLTFRRTSKGNRTLLRTMLSRDGACLAYLYHFKPLTPAASLTGGGLKILELQTHFANGAFICTSNAEAAGKLDSPPGVDALRLPANTPLDAIVAAHAQRVGACLANSPGLAAARIGNLEDVHRVQNVLQQIKSAWRRDKGISQEELQRLAGNRLAPEQIQALHAEVEEVRAERQRNAA